MKRGVGAGYLFFLLLALASFYKTQDTPSYEQAHAQQQSADTDIGEEIDPILSGEGEKDVTEQIPAEQMESFRKLGCYVLTQSRLYKEKATMQPFSKDLHFSIAVKKVNLELFNICMAEIPLQKQLESLTAVLSPDKSTNVAAFDTYDVKLHLNNPSVSLTPEEDDNYKVLEELEKEVLQTIKDKKESEKVSNESKPQSTSDKPSKKPVKKHLEGAHSSLFNNIWVFLLMSGLITGSLGYLWMKLFGKKKLPKPKKNKTK